MRELSIGAPAGVQQREITYDPTNRISNNAAGNYVPGPYEITDEILFGGLNFLLGAIDRLTGLDLLGMATILEGMFSPGALLSKLMGFLTPTGLIGAAAGVFGPLLTGGLFSGSLIPSLDASKIVSGVFSLAQLPLTVLNSVTGVASSLINGILGLINIPHLPASHTTSGVFLGSLIPGLDASKITSGAFAQSIVSGLTTDISVLTNTGHDIIDGIVNSLSGAFGSLWPQAQANEALKNQASALAQAAAALAQIQAGQNQGNTGGINALVDFSTFPDSTDLPSVFTETYSGSGFNFGVVDGVGRTTNGAGANLTRTFIGEYNVVDTLTDYQRVGAVWTGAPGISYQNPTPAFLPVPYFGMYRADTALYCRYKDVNNWVRVRFTPGDSVGNSGSAILESAIAGVVTQLGPSVGHSFMPNTAYWIEAGFGLSPRTFRVIAGTKVILTFTDSGTVTQLGPTFRGASAGGTSKGPVGLGGTVNPSPILYLTLQDNSPAGVVGSGGRVFRAATSASASSGSADAVMGNNTFDTVEIMTSDLTWTPLTGRITVSVTDWYVVSARINASAANSVIQFYRNGVMMKRGSSNAGPGAAYSASMYLVAGDYVQVGSSNSTTTTGNAGGTDCFFEITRVGKVVPA